MSIPAGPPRGSTATRGVSAIAHFAIGGGVAQQANRLYILTVRRESMIKKMRSLEAQLAQIKDQLQGIERDIGDTERKYSGLVGPRARRMGRVSKRSHDNGRRVNTVSLKF
ncbi:MAG: hypothetical protein HYT87_10970 [Nitrospirae bacterium]|nr:hypothetical protein [Nitrospirota bacterium]